MRGVTLLEFMAALSLFLGILFFSYHAFDSQRRLLGNLQARAIPEQESNYRLLLIKHFLERSSEGFQLDPMLESSPIFFPDLQFGASPQGNAFSVAHVTGQPFPFLRSGAAHTLNSDAVIQEDKTYLLAGSDFSGAFSWNYAIAGRVTPTANGLIVDFNVITANPEIEKGKLIEVEIHGFLYQDQTLYWVSPGGAAQPYLSALAHFEYAWNDPALLVRWKKGLMETEFRCTL